MGWYERHKHERQHNLWFKQGRNDPDPPLTSWFDPNMAFTQTLTSVSFALREATEKTLLQYNKEWIVWLPSKHLQLLTPRKYEESVHYI